MGVLSFLIGKLKLKPQWKGTPEMFLAMVLDLQARNNKVFSVHEVLQWGEVLQKVIKVRLAPYRDFPDLMQRGVPDYSMVEKMNGKLGELQQRKDLKTAIYGEKANFGDDDVMTSNAEGAVFARKMVKDLANYVDFPEEEQDNLKKL